MKDFFKPPTLRFDEMKLQNEITIPSDHYILHSIECSYFSPVTSDFSLHSSTNRSSSSFDPTENRKIYISSSCSAGERNGNVPTLSCYATHLVLLRRSLFPGRIH